MTAVFIALGILVGVLLAVILPWAVLRKLESEGRGEKDS
jgi:hypothetical protein